MNKASEQLLNDLEELVKKHKNIEAAAPKYPQPNVTRNVSGRKMANKTRYLILSPDGFSIHRTKTFPNPEKAWIYFDIWKKQFELQGYYSTAGQRIPLQELKDHCTLKPVISSRLQLLNNEHRFNNSNHR